MDIKNVGYNNFEIAVSSVTVSTSKVVGNGKTLKQMIQLLKTGGNVNLKTSIGGNGVNIGGKLGDDNGTLMFGGSGIVGAANVTLTAKFALGTGANADKLYMTVYKESL